MPEDFYGTGYFPPGVYVEELPGPVPAAPGISPTVIALVGDSLRERSYTEIIQLNATTAVQLTQLGIRTTSIEVKDRFTGVTYGLTTDYTVATQSGADATPGTADDTTTITRVGAGTIPDGTYVAVTYEYSDPNYNRVFRFLNYDDVVAAYGAPFDVNGAVQSEVALGAYLAFRQGAGELLIAAVDAAAATPTTAEWTTAIGKFIDEPSVNVIVPLTGDTAVHDVVMNHITQMEGLQSFRRAFFGRDGTVGTVTESNLTTQAAGYASTRAVIVSPTAFEFFDGNSRRIVTLGGQFAAAAVAGAHAARPVQEPLTRKPVVGFWDIPAQQTIQTLNTLASKGVTALQRLRDGTVVVRHSVTTAGSLSTANDYTRELSVVAAKDRLRLLVEESLDRSNLIGSVITEMTPELVMGVVVDALERARGSQLIFSYSAVAYRQPLNQPTVLEIRFQYRPSMPLNYIQVQFSIDTQSGIQQFEFSTPA